VSTRFHNCTRGGTFWQRSHGEVRFSARMSPPLPLSRTDSSHSEGGGTTRFDPIEMLMLGVWTVWLTQKLCADLTYFRQSGKDTVGDLTGTSWALNSRCPLSSCYRVDPWGLWRAAGRSQERRFKITLGVYQLRRPDLSGSKHRLAFGGGYDDTLRRFQSTSVMST